MKRHEFAYPRVREVDPPARRTDEAPPTTQRELVVASLLRKPDRRPGDRS